MSSLSPIEDSSASGIRSDAGSTFRPLAIQSYPESDLAQHLVLMVISILALNTEYLSLL
jgi:hypothetical protein